MKNEWITSWLLITSLTGRPTGTVSSLISRRPFGCWQCHIHCLPLTWISSAFSGILLCPMNTRAPQTNMTITISSGTTVQSSSSLALSNRSGGGAPSRRRYLTAKKITSPATSSVKNAVTASMKKYSASTRGARFEACGGNSEKLLSIGALYRKT